MQLLLWEYSQDLGAKDPTLQCQESCEDLKKLVARRCAVPLSCSFLGISIKLLLVIFPFVIVTVQAQLWICTYWKADTSSNATGLL